VIPPHTELELRAGVTFAIGDGIAGVDEPTAPIAIHAQADVRALGTEHEPVLFTWLTPGKHWSAFTIFEPSAQNSVFEHAIFEHGYEGQFTSSELLDDGSRKTVGMRGALSLYKASARISHCTFRENEGDDGLNLRASHSIVEYSTFVDQFGDALDADQPGSVEIRYNFFGNNPNDAVDLGEGSEAYVHHNLIYKSGDKGISMGEKSSPRIENNLIVGCSVGIGNKDGSTPTVDGNTLFDNLSGIAAYEAVAGLGAGAGIFTNNIVWHTDQRAAEALELGAPLEDLDLQADSKALFGFSCIRDPSAADPERLGVGVISEGNGCNDPLFVNPTLDDWQAMNFHVRSAAGRWDAALKEFVTDDETSPTIDAGDPEADVGYESEPNGSRKNLGFDAGTEKASRSRE
jgi:parallel beta-helix repeat protein